MHQTQPSSAFPFEVCLQKKKENPEKTTLEWLAGHVEIVPDSFTLQERLIQSKLPHDSCTLLDILGIVVEK